VQDSATTPLRLQPAAHAEIDFLLVSHMFVPPKATQALHLGQVELQHFVWLEACVPEIS
jgi:hypothetical protein